MEVARRTPPTAIIRSAERTLKLLEVLASYGSGGAGLKQLSNRLGINIGTCHHLLSTLMYARYVKQHNNGNYCLGVKAIELAVSVLEEFNLVRECLPAMQKMMRMTEETVNLSILDNTDVLVVQKVESPASMRLFFSFGRRAPVHSTAAGKVLLMKHTPEEVRKILASYELTKYTPQTITDPQQFIVELDRVRKAGYAVDNEECEIGARCVATPIFNYTGQVVAAISIAGPITRFNDSRILELANYLRAGTREISSAMGHRIAGHY